MKTEYVLNVGGCWSGRPHYSFAHEGKLLFQGQNYHSELHAKREAVEYLSNLGIQVEVEDIIARDNGTL